MWPASFVVARAYVDQLERGKGLSAVRLAAIRRSLTRAEGATGPARQRALTQLGTELQRDGATASDKTRVTALAGVVADLAKATP